MNEIIIVKDGLFYNSGRYTTTTGKGVVYEIDGKRYRVGEQIISKKNDDTTKVEQPTTQILGSNH
jgi:cation transport ATPase